VCDCTGKFLKVDVLTAAYLAPALANNLYGVVVSAPVKEPAALNVVLGCNHQKLAGQKIITNASCTTNCLAPVVKVIMESFG